MKIGVLGSGDVAKALAGGFVKHGHQVVLGTRDAAKLADWVVQHRGAQTGGLADAAKFAELVVLAVKGTVREMSLANPLWGAPRILKTRGSFPNDDAALKLLYLAIKNAAMRWRRGIEWTAAMGQFAIQVRGPPSVVYPVHVITRKSFGLMMRKLSVTESQRSTQFPGTFPRRKLSVASANWAQVA